MKKLLVLGGNRSSCEIVKKARKMGIYVIVTDYNPVEKSPAKQFANQHFMVSCTDIEAVVQLIREENIDGVIMGFNDLLLPYYAQICKRVGFPAYGTQEQFEIFINKDKYKALMKKYQVPTVEEYVIDICDFKNSTKDIAYPVLVKPADSSGAKGISICKNKDELKKALEKAENFSRTGKILVEKYLEGEEATVFWVFKDGEYYLTALANRHVKLNQEGVIPLPVGYTYPSVILPQYRKNIEPLVKEMLQSVGIKNGMMFMQCKVIDGECIVYDIGYRLTGSFEFKNIKALCGYDPLEMMINFALTGSMGVDDLAEKVNPEFNQKYGFNVSFLLKPGKIADIIGMEEVKKLPGVVDAVIAHYPGEEITESMRGLLAQIGLRVLGTAESVEELKTIMFKIQDTVKIISDKGENMILPGMELSDYNGTVMEW